MLPLPLVQENEALPRAQKMFFHHPHSKLSPGPHPFSHILVMYLVKLISRPCSAISIFYPCQIS